MNRKASSLTSIGLSSALIALVIWFLHDLYATPWAVFDGWHFSNHGSMMGGGGMGIIMLIFWVMVVVAIILLVSGVVSNRRPWHGEDTPVSPLDILKRRYARGEIDRETFEAMKQELQQ